jgi:hypothetical protein
MRVISWLSLLTSIVFVLAGCGDKRKDSTVTNTQAFANSPVEVSQAWEKALQAEKSNDYVTAETSLYWLTRQSLTPDQKQAVDHQLTTVNARLTEALEKGDPAARAALQELRNNPPNRQR